MGYVVKSGVVGSACNPSTWVSQGEEAHDLMVSLGSIVNIGPFKATRRDYLQKQRCTCYTNNNNNSDKCSSDLTPLLTFFILTAQSELETIPRMKEMGHNILVYLLTCAMIFSRDIKSHRFSLQVMLQRKEERCLWLVRKWLILYIFLCSTVMQRLSELSRQESPE